MPVFPNATGPAWEVLNKTGLRQNEFSGGRAPSATDDITGGFERGSRWWDGEKWYTCRSNIAGSAVWAVDDAAAASAMAERAEASAVPVASYAAALAAAQIPFLNKIGAVVSGRLVEWVRQAGGTALGGGWKPAGDVTPYHFGAVGDGDANDTAAMQAAALAVPDGGRLYLPPGIFAVSETVTFSARRATVHFDGKMVPHGTFTDYLFRQAYAGAADPLMINVGNIITVTRMEFDGRWQSRGVYFENIYLSSLAHVIAYKTHGTAIRVDVGYECTWTQATMTLCKNRTGAWVAGAALWDAVTTYPAGTYVRRGAPAYNAGTTYDTLAVVESGGISYRSMRDGNIGNTPGTDTAFWVRIEPEYFEAISSSTNQDPIIAANTTNGGGPWMQALAHEPVLDLNCTNPGGLVDHQYFYGLDIRDCDARTLINIDNQRNTRPVVNMEFYGAQIHSLTPGIGVASGGQLVEGASDFVSVRLGRCDRVKFYGANIRLGSQMQTAIGLQLGGRNTAKVVRELVFHGDFSGEAARQVGIYVGQSVVPAKQFIGQVNNQLIGTNPRLLADPAQRLHNIWSTTQQFADGTNERPGLAFASEVNTGFRRPAAGIMDQIIAGVRALRVYMVGPNLGLLTPLFPEFPDDAAAGVGGVVVGQWYRTGSTIKQRVS